MTKENDPLTDCYEVEITIFATVFVRGAKSEEEAMEFAEGELPGMQEVNEIRPRQLRKSEVDSVRRHADYKSEPR